MTAQEKLKKFKNLPSTLIVNGLSALGVQLARSLLEQRGFVIIIDEYKEENAEKIEELSNYESFTFIDKNGIEKLSDKLKNLDYLILLDDENLSTGREFTPNEYLSKCNDIDSYLKFALSKKSKVLLTTSFETHQNSINETMQRRYMPQKAVYSEIELQRYEEKLLFNYYNKDRLDVRVIRLGQLYGPGSNIKRDTTLNNLIKQSLKSKYLTIRGDGLEENYFIHIYDATYGLIKALFSSQTNGEVFNLVNTEDNTTLSIAYSLIETEAKAKQIKFIEEDYQPPQLPIDETPNLSRIGWKSRIKLEQGLAETIHWLIAPKSDKKQKDVGKELVSSEVEPNVAKKSNELTEKIKKLWKRIIDFFTVSEEELLIKKNKRPDGILSKLSKTTAARKRMIIQGKLTKKISKKEKPSRTKVKVPRIPITKYKRYIKSNTVKVAYLSVAAILLYFFVFEPFIGLVGNLSLSAFDGYKVTQSLSEGDYDEIHSNLIRLESHTKKSQKSFQKFNFLFKIIGKESNYTNISNLLTGAMHLAKGGAYSANLINPALNYLNDFSLSPDPEISYEEELQLISSNSSSMDLAYLELLRANNYFDKVDFSKIPIVGNKESGIREVQSNLFDKLLKYKDLVQVLPSIVGYPEKKDYLIIFQNNTELRSTGGFIGSYAIMSLENGAIRNLTIDDIYNPDGQLKTYVEPPEPLKLLLQDSSWAMRDANWEPDFPTTARQIEWFYKLETGQEVDGVISVNTSLIEELLKLTGPVYMESVDKTISSSNFFEAAEDHHLDFVPGSTDKKDFLGTLAQTLLSEINDADIEFLTSFAQTLEKLLGEREIFIFLNNPDAQQIITRNDWDGSIAAVDGDYLFPVENNLGGNKVNRYVERTISENILLNGDTELHDLSITYTNKSKSSEWPGGIYRNYLSLYIPNNSTDISYSGIEESIISSNYDYTVISGFVNIDPQKMGTISVSFQTKLVKELPLDKKSYDLLIQKQSGIEETYIDLTVSYPSTWTLESEKSSISSKEGLNSISYYGLQNTDVNVEMEFRTE